MWTSRSTVIFGARACECTALSSRAVTGTALSKSVPCIVQGSCALTRTALRKSVACIVQGLMCCQKTSPQSQWVALRMKTHLQDLQEDLHFLEAWAAASRLEAIAPDLDARQSVCCLKVESAVGCHFLGHKIQLLAAAEYSLRMHSIFMLTLDIMMFWETVIDISAAQVCHIFKAWTPCHNLTSRTWHVSNKLFSWICHSQTQSEALLRINRRRTVQYQQVLHFIPAHPWEIQGTTAPHYALQLGLQFCDSQGDS